MGGGVVAGLHRIPGPRQHRPGGIRHHRADRHFAPVGGGAGFLQGDFDRRGHGPSLPQWAVRF